MLYYIKKYPFSLLILLSVVYLSFFKPPSTNLSTITNLDKVAHFCMYFGLSGVLWLEFLRGHRLQGTPIWHAWIGACLLPILLGGCVELLQSCTDYRGGDWWDFAANTIGVVAASLIAYFGVRRQLMKNG